MAGLEYLTLQETSPPAANTVGTIPATAESSITAVRIKLITAL
jgi:hypothetical protein